MTSPGSFSPVNLETTSNEASIRPSVFDKCRASTERVAQARAAKAYCYYRVIDSAQDPEVVVDGRKLIMLGSNNYLGLTNHPKVKEAAVEAVRRFGTGCAGSRLLNGTLSLHEMLEDKLARFIGKPAVVTFSTGFQVNLGTISCLLGRGDIVYLDKQDHACIIDGARLSFARIRKFAHNDPMDLRRLMAAEPGGAGRLVVVDGVFSMEGDITPLRRSWRSRASSRRGSWSTMRTGWVSSAAGAGAPPSTSISRMTCISSWGRSRSRWPRSAASSRASVRLSITSGTPPAA